MFVRENNHRLVPLVGDYKGRLRVINGQVYNELAHSVNLADDGTMIIGGRYMLAEAATTNVNDRVMFQDLGPQAQFGPSDAMTAAGLLQELMSFDSLAPAPEVPFVSADINQPVDAPDMTPAAPPAPLPEDLDATQASGGSREIVEVQPAVRPRRNDQ